MVAEKRALFKSADKKLGIENVSIAAGGYIFYVLWGEFCVLEEK
jgi:hypothetical protein